MESEDDVTKVFGLRFNSIEGFYDLSEEDKEILQDMMVIAVNDAMKQIDKETEKMLGAYGSQLNGLF